MRKPYIAANWKMMKNIAETEEFINSFIPLVNGISDVDILIAPPFTSLGLASHLLLPTNIKLGAQNMFYEESGAYTGEISADMLLFAGCSTVIIGHSERRQFFGETDETVNKKIKMARSKGLEVILCIGESLQDREAGRTYDLLGKQLTGSLKDLSLDGITIAYEPIWAIGTGKTATPQIANETHTYIREWLNQNKEKADNVRIQYGGSVKPENIGELMAEPEIDGALVGGASLNPESFANIIKGARK
ncbi:MAG: triose-phosphate isomerase [Thermodesulfovibrionia bacterium]|nr:triose-phosphate isomerase [Thermodesulfovibrionia bacterium]